MVVGIVAEYNPFHNGHKLQIDYAKNELHADAVVVAMSGNFTQRGEIACFDKYLRAEAALKCGADIVLEIPTIFATSSAREFAAAGVQLLAKTGIVDTILFGAETDDKSLFVASAKKLIELEQSGSLDSKIKELVSNGESFATARSRALADYIPDELKESPNNILGLEYCRYILENNLNIDIALLKRTQNNYHDKFLTGDISSATAIRNCLSACKPVTGVPAEAATIYENAIYVDANDVSEILHYKLLSTEDYEKFLDCSKDLSDRIKNHINEFIDLKSFCSLLKTKNITYSRLTRIMSHILLDIKTDDFEAAKALGYITYLRMLGFSTTGAECLNKIKELSSLPLITKTTDAVDHHDIFSSDVYRIIKTSKKQMAFPNEYTRKYNLTNIKRTPEL